MGINLILQDEKYKFAVITILLGVSFFLIYYFHFIMGTKIIFTHFFYIPIILSAIWWKRNAIIIPLVLAAVLILSNIIAGDIGISFIEDLFRASMFIFVGIIVIFLSEEIEKSRRTLKESEEKFRLLFNEANDMITLNLINEDGLPGDFIEVNEVACERLGYSREELLNMGPKNIVAKDKIAEMQENARKLCKDGHSTFEIVHVNRKGKRIPVEVNNHLFKIKGKTVALAISRDITERKKAEKQLKQSLKEKEILVREIHHRVKNNLMVISSLLNLQSAYIKDKESYNIFKESQSRAQSMALIHERLYRSDDLKEINFGEYIETLSTELYRTYITTPDRVNLNMNVEDAKIDINTAVPLGLIVNELVSNCMKHAFPAIESQKPAKGAFSSQANEMKGEISISFKKIDDKFILDVKDNGIGFPDELDFKNTDSLGLQLVNSLVEQIDGEIDLNVNNGTEFKITFSEMYKS
jgi:PAS domain S-box-containing protein